MLGFGEHVRLFLMPEVWHRVKSTRVAGFSHEGSTCFVIYNSNRVYRYGPVSAEVFGQILAEPSAGKAIKKYLEKPGISYEEVRDFDLGAILKALDEPQQPPELQKRV